MCLNVIVKQLVLTCLFVTICTHRLKGLQGCGSKAELHQEDFTGVPIRLLK
jgi:hypothetical protein